MKLRYKLILMNILIERLINRSMNLHEIKIQTDFNEYID